MCQIFKLKLNFGRDLQNSCLLLYHVYCVTFLVSNMLLADCWFKKNPWKKIFANDISDKGLVSKTYKELVKLGMPRWHPRVAHSVTL